MSRITRVQQIIQASPFWDSDVARDGTFLVIGDFGAWHLLVPDNQSHILPNFETAKWVEFHEDRTWTPLCWRVVFVDRAEKQFGLSITKQVFMPLPVPTRQKPLLLIHDRAGLQQQHVVRRVIAERGPV